MPLTVTVTPLSATTIEVNWAITPEFVGVRIIESDSAGNQIVDTGQILGQAGPTLFTGLTPDTTYFYEVCTLAQGDFGTSEDCSAWDAWSGHTQHEPSPPPPPQLHIQIMAVVPYPNHLAKAQGTTFWERTDNGIVVHWVASEPVNIGRIELDTPAGAPVKAENIGGSNPSTSGVVGVNPEFDVPAPGATYLVKIAGGPPNGPTTESDPVQFTAPLNFNALRPFLAASGLLGSNGIRQYVPPLTPPNQPFGLRAEWEL
jgi:hypothetical protein